MLEPHSAKGFVDEALEIPIDTSKIIWILTANEASTIPEPILSRIQIFNIAPPDPEQMVMIINNIYRNIINDKPYGKGWAWIVELFFKDTKGMKFHVRRIFDENGQLEIDLHRPEKVVNLMIFQLMYLAKLTSRQTCWECGLEIPEGARLYVPGTIQKCRVCETKGEHKVTLTGTWLDNY